MTPRDRALTVILSGYPCQGECANDALLCVTHERIKRTIEADRAAMLGGGNTMLEPERDPNTGIVVG